MSVRIRATRSCINYVCQKKDKKKVCQRPCQKSKKLARSRRELSLKYKRKGGELSWPHTTNKGAARKGKKGERG